MRKNLTVLLILSLLLGAGMSSAQDNQPSLGSTPSGSASPGIQMRGAMGATVINGVSYQFFSLRPDIPIWRFGLGLDLSFYFDADGNLREEDWDEAADIIDKIYYLRYGHAGDPFYAKVGSLDPLTLGYGLVMRRYSNAIEWPQVRRIGLHSQINLAPYGLEMVVNNFREIDSPGLLAARITYELNLGLPLVFGGTVAYDGNQFLGAPDADKDGIPDRVDQFPGKNDAEHIQWLFNEVGLTADQVARLVESGDLPDINNPPASIADSKDPVTEYGVDVGLPLIRGSKVNLWLYAQAAQIKDYGRGYTIPGLKFSLGPFFAGAEYRIFEKKFQADYFDLSYELHRVTWNEADHRYETKESRLENLPAAQGYYADAGVNLMNWVDIYGAYQQMFYDDADIPSQSIYASLNLNTRMVPKLDLAQGYFQQPNADKPFSTEADGTVLGWRIGMAMAEGVTLVYDNKTIYYNNKPTHVMTIETVLTF
ncbi:MAG: hypothetical protein V2A61_02615 [Calditrichota bacterium]